MPEVNLDALERAAMKREYMRHDDVLALIRRLRALRTWLEDIESYAYDYVDDAPMREVLRMAVAAIDSKAGSTE